MAEQGKDEIKMNRDAPAAPPTAAAEPEQETVGALLRRTRQAKKQDLRDIASYLCIRPLFLEAIEEGRRKELPGDTYAAGFVRSYAAYLGLDAENIVARYKAELNASAEARRASAEMADIENEDVLPGARTILVSFLILLAAFGLWKLFSGTDEPAPVSMENVAVVEDEYPLEPLPDDAAVVVPLPPVPPVKPAVSDESVVPPDEADVAEAVAAAPEPVPVTGTPLAEEKKAEEPIRTIHIYGQRNENPRIVLVANDDAWIEVTRGDLLFISRTLKKGDRYQVSRNPENLYLKTGNAGGLDIYVDGNPVPPIGPKGATRTRISLDPAYLVPKNSADAAF